MSIIDIVLLVILVLAALSGFIKGFGKSSLKIFAFLFALAAAYFFGIPLARGLMGTAAGSGLTGLYLKNVPDTGIFVSSLVGVESDVQQALLSQGFAEMHFPAFFRGFFISGVFDMTADVRTAVASSFSYYTLVLIFFFVFLILFSVLLHLLFKIIAEPILGEDGKGIVGRLLGLVKHVFFAGLDILIVMAVLVFIDQLLMRADIMGLHDWLAGQLGLGTSNFSLGRLFYDTAYAFLGWITQIGG